LELAPLLRCRQEASLALQSGGGSVNTTLRVILDQTGEI
jgi:hypothetical protein